MFKNSKINFKILKTQKINLKQLRKIISERGFVLKKKRNFFNFNELRSFYYTIASSLVLILIVNQIPETKNSSCLTKDKNEGHGHPMIHNMLALKPLGQAMQYGISGVRT